MSRIIFAWELGANYGYISQLLPFARELKKRGHEVAIAVRELHHMYRVLEHHGIPVLQAPLWLPAVQGLPEPPLNYAEMLLRFGYHDVQALGSIVNAWRALLLLFRADLVVACHAPTALLAARTMGLRMATLGTGFLLPPSAPTPNMRPWLEVSPQRLESSDAIVLQTVNTILQSCAQPLMASLADWFEVDENFLCTFPELDHYPNRQGATYYGVAYDQDIGRPVSWPPGEGKCVLVYLSGSLRDLSPLVEALGRLKLRALVFALGVSPDQCSLLSSDRVRVSGDPVHLDGVLPQCDLAICNAGHGTTARMLLAGVPVLLFTAHLEQYLLAWRVQQMGAGRLLEQEAPTPDFEALIRHMLEQPGYCQSAAAFARRHADFSPAVQLDRICQRIEAMVA